MMLGSRIPRVSTSYGRFPMPPRVLLGMRWFPSTGGVSPAFLRGVVEVGASLLPRIPLVLVLSSPRISWCVCRRVSCPLARAISFGVLFVGKPTPPRPLGWSPPMFFWNGGPPLLIGSDWLIPQTASVGCPPTELASLRKPLCEGRVWVHFRPLRLYWGHLVSR